MNFSKKILAFAALICLMPYSITAKKLPNKQRITVINNYGEKVLAQFLWKGYGWDVSQEVVIKSQKDKNSLIQPAPYSKYHLYSIQVTPLENIQGKSTDEWIAAGNTLLSSLDTNSSMSDKNYYASHYYENVDAKYEHKKSLNKDVIKFRGATKFVIEAGENKIKANGQQEIFIKEYTE